MIVMTLRLARWNFPRLCIAGLLLASVGGACFAQQTPSLTLDQALRMAKNKNGTLKSALYALQTARSQRSIALGAFLPTLTPSFSYQTGRTRYQTSAPNNPGGTTNSLGSNTALTASIPLLDNGSRYYALDAARRNAESAREDLASSVRRTLFQVHQQFFEALRAQEILRVQEAQRQRAQLIMEQTELRVKLGDEARKQILQAKADVLNAEVLVLQAESQVKATRAALQATVGWSVGQDLPPLVDDLPKQEPIVLPEESAAVQLGLETRPDLASRRYLVQATQASLRQAQMSGSFLLSLDAEFRKNFGRDVFERSQIALTATIPLFDGNVSKEQVRIRQFALETQKELLLQGERDARAEIVTAYHQLAQNQKRMAAAEAALEAAQENYNAATEARRLGASTGTLLDVLTAQVSLSTAESNRVQALYDLLISRVQYLLATGQRVAGEDF